jgi:hypothetical protein
MFVFHHYAYLNEITSPDDNENGYCYEIVTQEMQESYVLAI